MIIAVETNFILELALEQAEAEHADNIVKLAESKQIELAVPACAFPEAYARIKAQSKRRNRILNDLRPELSQMTRSRAFAGLHKASETISLALISSAHVHATDLAKTVDRLRACATIIPLTTEVTRDMSMLDPACKLEPADAFIYASVDSYLRERTAEIKFFVTKDMDFEKTAGRLRANGIVFSKTFGSAFGTIKKKLATQ